MIVIGITGGIGSGKSAVSKLLEEEYGAYIINTDEVARNLMEKDQVSYNLIVDYFGDSILDEEGNINRSKLGFIVYKDENELLKLNSFSHPYVEDEVRYRINEKRQANYKYVCIETALPTEANLKNLCDEIWFIYASEDTRIKRLQESRNYPLEKIKDIMDSQLSNEEYKKYASNIIINEKGIEEVKEQIDKILVTK